MLTENAKNTVPIAVPPQGRRDCNLGPSIFGRRKIACDKRDKAPAASRRVFLTESRDIVFKRIAQKRFFFYQTPIHDKWLTFRLLSTLKVFTKRCTILSDVL
jgi:hypothetical protein